MGITHDLSGCLLKAQIRFGADLRDLGDVSDLLDSWDVVFDIFDVFAMSKLFRSGEFSKTKKEQRTVFI